MEDNVYVAERRTSRQAFEPHARITDAVVDVEAGVEQLRVEWEFVSTTTTQSEYSGTIAVDSTGDSASISGTFNSYESGTSYLPLNTSGDILITLDGTITQSQEYAVSDEYLLPGESEEFDLSKITVNNVATVDQADPGQSVSVDYEVSSSHGVPVYVYLDIEADGQVVDPFTQYIDPNSTASDSRFVTMPSDVSGTVDVCCVEVGGETTN